MVVINSGTETPRELINKMIDIQHHRGPDGFGSWVDEKNNLAIGHNRLAIIEPSELGRQPWLGVEDKLVLSWNGEIYNFERLRSDLINLGLKFFTDTDSEVILKGYSQWGNELFNKLQGMFAIVIYDKSQNIVVCARDRFGIKPLYYAIIESNIYIASETKTIRKIIKQANEINEEMVERFRIDGSVIFRNETFFKNIFSFPISSFSVVHLNPQNMEFCDYWGVPSICKYEELSSVELQSSISEAILKHLRSDVPVCVAASGGIDSSIIAVEVAKQEAKRNLKTSTFTISWPNNPKIDETKWVAELLEFANISNISRTVDIEELESLVEQTIGAQDEPFASSTVIAQFVLYRTVSEKGFKVILDGQGADELFLGYQGLLDLILREKLHRFRILSLIKDLKFFYIYRRIMKLDFKWFIKTTIVGILPAKLLKRYKGSPRNFRLHYLREKLLLDGNLQSLLKYQDRNSMHWSVESRVPFLDHILVEKVLKTDPAKTLAGGKLKVPLREAFKNMLPAPIYNRVDKLGYTTPEAQWLAELDVKIDSNLELGSRQWREFVLAKWKNYIEND